jgi:ubiquitin C-terminal hydrolase
MTFPMTFDADQYCVEAPLRDNLGDTRYDLYAVIVHQGRSDSGHYVAFVKRESQWYNFNDEYYDPVRDIDVLK